MDRTELYTAADLARLEKRIRVWTVIAAAAGAAGLIACVILCCLTGTANTAEMERASVIVSTAVGWVVIYLLVSVVAAGKRERRHAELLRTGERTAYTGRVTVTDKRLRIPGGGIFYHVELEDAAGVHRLRVVENRRRQLSRAGEHLTLLAVHGYVAAYEVTPCE